MSRCYRYNSEAPGTLEQRRGDSQGRHDDWFRVEPEPYHDQSAENYSQGEGAGEADPTSGGVRRLDVHPFCDDQVVEEGDDGQDGAEEHEPVEPGSSGGPEHVELRRSEERRVGKR